MSEDLYRAAYRFRISKVTVAMRTLLIEHMDGVKVPFILPVSIDDTILAKEAQARIQTTNALVTRGLIRRTRSRRHTVITDEGRVMLSKLLGGYADALVRASELLRPGERPEWLVNLIEAIVNTNKVTPPELVP